MGLDGGCFHMLFITVRWLGVTTTQIYIFQKNNTEGLSVLILVLMTYSMNLQVYPLVMVSLQIF